MITNKKKLYTLIRTNSLPPDLDSENSIIYNYSLWIELNNKLTNIFKNIPSDKWTKYYSNCPDIIQENTIISKNNVITEINDWFPIELPHNPLWEKRGNYIMNIITNEELRHDKVIHAGWNYVRICWNPISPLSLHT